VSPIRVELLYDFPNAEMLLEHMGQWLPVSANFLDKAHIILA
jgi:hypothetical protein